MDLFGSETSETLEREFTERGYESFVAKTQVKKGTNVRMKDYRAEMKSALQNMDIFKKMPKSYKRQVAGNPVAQLHTRTLTTDCLLFASCCALRAACCWLCVACSKLKG